MDRNDPEYRCDPDAAHDRRADDQVRVDPDQLLKHFGAGWAELPKGKK